MQRFPDWASRLEVFLHAQQRRQFHYGEWDCCLFVCDGIRAMTGTDPAAHFRGHYGSAKGAIAMMREMYGLRSVGDLVSAVAAEHGMVEVPVARARRGDVVLVKRPRDFSLGLLALNGGQILGPQKVGLGAVPRFAGSRAWNV